MRQLWDVIQQHLGPGLSPNVLEDERLHSEIRKLSRALTTSRENLPTDYIADAKAQRAYLAYYVPLNFEKIRLLLASHSGIWPEPASQADQGNNSQRWVDFGCGPGTATLAALAAIKSRIRVGDRRSPKTKAPTPPKIHVDLVDGQPEALKLAGSLITELAKKLELDVTLGSHQTLSDAIASMSGGDRYDLALAANVLNELPAHDDAKGDREPLLQLWDHTCGAMLVLEPSHRVSSQRLVRFRERLLKHSAATSNDARILGPCTHGERCPVYRTNHWCHFSEPVADGRLIDLNLRVFKNPRQWLKFSYLIVARGQPLEPWETRQKKIFRAIGDLHPSGPKTLAIDLCQPGSKWSLRLPRNLPPDIRNNLVRGATVELGDDRQVKSRPLTKR